MADGDKLLRITNPNNPMVALARNARADRKRQAFIGSGNTVGGSDLGTSNVPRVETDDIAATLIPDHDGSGNWRPYIRVNVTGGYASTRSFVGYRVRVLPAIGAAFEIDGPAFPNTPIPIDIHNLPTPPHTSETWQLQVRVITSIWGAGFWSDYVPITWGGDPDAPAAPSFPSGWVLLNVYDEVQRISRFHITWNQNTEPDLDRYILEYAIGTGGSGPLTGGDGPTTLTWVRMPPISPETTRYEFNGVFAPSAVVNIRLLAQDTSGNQSPWTQQPPVTMAPEPLPTPPNGTTISWTGDHSIAQNQYITTMTWTDSTDPNCAEYDIKIWQGNNTPQVLPHISRGGIYTFPPLGGGTWHFAIRSVTPHGLPGNWSTPDRTHDLGYATEGFYNGGLEIPDPSHPTDPTYALGWSDVSIIGGSAMSYFHRDGSQHFEGAWGGLLRSYSSGDGGMAIARSPRAIVAAGQAYTMHLKYMSTGNQFVLAQIDYRWLNASGTLILGGSGDAVLDYNATGNTTWQTVEFGGVAPSGAAYLELNIINRSVPFSSAYVDVFIDNLTMETAAGRLDPSKHIGVGTMTPENTEGWNRALETFGTANSKTQTRTGGGITTRVWSHDAGYNGMSAGGAIGTSSNHPFHLYSNNTKRMTLNTDGSMNVFGTMKNSGGIYQLEMSGDQYGGTRLELMNRGGANGVRYTLVPDDNSIQLIDFMLGHPGGTRNIRLEGRVGFCVLGTAQEFQYGDPSAFHTYISSAGLYQSSGYIQGSYKSADGSIGVSTTVTLAKVTTGGANGSMTIKNGVITSITNPT